MHLITSAQSSDHIYPIDDATIYRALTGESSCVFNYGNKFAPSILSATSISIGTGIGMIQGRMFAVESSADTVTIGAGSQGMSRIDIVCMKVVKNSDGTQTGSWYVVQGTPAASNPSVPTYTEGDLDGADTTGLFGVIRVDITNVSITSASTINTPISGYSTGGDVLPLTQGGTGVTSLSALKTLLGLGTPTTETLSTGAYITRNGNLRILEFHQRGLSSTTLYTLASSDRPNSGMGGGVVYAPATVISSSSTKPAILRIQSSGAVQVSDHSGYLSSGDVTASIVYWV